MQKSASDELKVSKKLRVSSSPPEIRLGVRPRFSPCSTHKMRIPKSAELMYIELDFQTRPSSLSIGDYRIGDYRY